MGLTVGPFSFSINLALIFVFVLVTFIVGIRLGRKRGIDVEPALWKILVIGVVSARLAFVLTYLDIYRQAPWTVLDIRDGGFTPAAGMFAALAVTGWFVAQKQEWRKPLLISLLAGVAVWGGISALVVMNTKASNLPLIALTSLDGRTVRLDALTGKPMVVNIWATWCPPCRREMPVLRDAQARDKDVTFVFVNQGESAETVREFLDSKGLVLGIVLLDRTGQLGPAQQ
jgi:thiol-disulfide isomerase/thioredoxin